MATNSPDHHQNSWQRLVAGSRAESPPSVDIRTALQRELGRMTGERSAMRTSLLDLVATWRMPSAIAVGVGVIAGISIFVMRDAPTLLSDPFLFLLTNR